MKPIPPLLAETGWKQQVRIYRRIYNLFHTYLHLDCSYIPAENYSDWSTLFFSRLARLPYHFENYFGHIEEGIRYNHFHFDRAKGIRRSVVAKHWGFYDLFTPVVSGGRCHGILMTGPFLKSPPTLQELSRQWVQLSGRQVSSEDPDFLAYVRMALDITVLAPPSLKGCRELFEILASYMAGDIDGNVEARLENLRKGAISHHLPHVNWMDVVMGFDKFNPNIRTYSLLGSQRGRVQNWEKEEFGITRYPTNVIAVTHHSMISEKLPAVGSMLGSNRLQWEALRVAREIPETVGGKLEDYGAIFLTSASPEKSNSQARMEIRDRAEEIRRRLERRTGMRLWVGVGSTLSPGDQLADSRRQAVLSMNLCGSLGRPVVFYEDYAGQMSQQGRSSLNSFLRRLLTAYQKGSKKDRETAQEEYIRRALSSSNERGEKLRMYLLEAVLILVETLRGRFLSEGELDVLVDSMEKKLEGAVTLQDMLAIFREGLDLVTRIMAQPLEGKRSILMEQVKEYVDRHMAENLRIGDLAKKIGLSKPVFLAGFRRMTGQGFSQYLQKSRIEEAKRMLETSTLRVSRVAQECGFNSLSYFIQAFKRSTGLSPRCYRNPYQK